MREPVAFSRATAREIWDPLGWLQSRGTMRVAHWYPLWLLQVAQSRGWGAQPAGNPLSGSASAGGAVVVVAPGGVVVEVVEAGPRVVVVVVALEPFAPRPLPEQAAHSTAKLTITTIDTRRTVTRLGGDVALPVAAQA
jgi:hypothetical protein